LSILANDSTDHAVRTTTNIFEKIQHNLLNTHSLIVLGIALAVALLAGRLIAHVLRQVVGLIGRRADKIENLNTVNRLRRYETFIILSIAVIRTALVLFAIYFWWMYVHPSGRPTAIIGASAIAALLLSGMLSPALRDIVAGSLMMAEQWYGVGDHIKIEPFADMQGVVERVTLRSTRLRGLNGEIMWINNQNIMGVRLAPRGIRTLGLEMFVDDLTAGEQLVAKANRRLPIGPLLVLGPLEIISSEQVGDQLWHITAIGDTAPGREWLIEHSAVELIKELDEKSKRPALAHGPLARYADVEAERRFRRTINNARKRPKQKKRRAKPVAKKVKSVKHRS
jgi:hypothetical protein